MVRTIAGGAAPCSPMMRGMYARIVTYPIISSATIFADEVRSVMIERKEKRRFIPETGSSFSRLGVMAAGERNRPTWP